MNLWANRIGQLSLVVVALFFFSCDAEDSILGFENESSKFQLKFIDIPLSSSNLLLDSVRTSNFNAGNDLNRLLVGRYNDPIFGLIEASGYTQFVPVGTLASVAGGDTVLVYDSAIIRVKPDWYGYGTLNLSNESFTFHEIDEPLPVTYSRTVESTVGGQGKPNLVTYNFQKFYFNANGVTYDPTPLATATIKSVDLNIFRNVTPSLPPQGFRDSVRLSDDFGMRLFANAKTADSTFRTSLFTKSFPGLAILPTASNEKILGIDLDSTFVELHYHRKSLATGNKLDTLKFIYKLNASQYQIASFNNLEFDRSGTALENLVPNQLNNDIDTRYVQGGSGIVTVVNLQAVIDSLKDYKWLSINSAELIISDVVAPQNQLPPQNLILKLVDDNNTLKKLSYPGKGSIYDNDLKLLSDYRGYVNFDATNNFLVSSLNTIPFDSTLNVLNDSGGFLSLSYSSETNSYRTKSTQFFQQLIQTADDKTPITKIALYPYTPSSSNPSYGKHIIGKTLNGVSFDKDKIKLRVYYTIPTVD
jgi:hypothetical protein